MESNLPATRDETTVAPAEDGVTLAPRQPLRVAFLPLALVTFVLLALTIAAWTFLVAAT
ncbi:MAG: hypothetical protein M3153_11230 [Chloroflexota bacterium]|nr:hypothetical protein [Chloroflexota bacterium]